MKAIARLAAAIAFTAATFVPSIAEELSPFFAAMNVPIAPFQIGDNLYYVGAKDVTSFLIATDKGLILTDGGFASTAKQILANVRTLGFDPKNVRILMSSHAHFDHAAGLAELKTETGAMLYASAGDKPALESGGAVDFIDLGPGTKFSPVKVDHVVHDGEKISLGHTSLTIHLTPGHTRGCTSWSLTTHVADKPEQVLFICSLTVLPSYSLVKKPSYPGIAEDYAASIAKLRKLPCDIMLGSHGSFFDLLGKREKQKSGDAAAFVDHSSCKSYLDGADTAYQSALSKEKAAP